MGRNDVQEEKIVSETASDKVLAWTKQTSSRLACIYWLQTIKDGDLFFYLE